MKKEWDEKVWTTYQAIYVHIPFCRQKCIYCDFASYAGCSDATMHAYTDALCHEIATRASLVPKVSHQATIFFGGGTPSVLPTDCLAQIVGALKKYGFWQQPAEATIEVNPGTADLAKLQRLRALGFDRISYGVQSLNDGELKTIGRIHNAAQALEAIRLARQAGFARVSADLIYGLPGQSMTSLQQTLSQMMAADVDHVSVYGLQVEEGTPLEKLLNSGKLTLPTDDETADMYEEVQRVLKLNGFVRYEISNYAKPGQASLHNTVYWQYHPYLAFGAAATGFDGTMRRTAADTVEDYIALASNLNERNWQESALYECETLNVQDQLAEYMFMGLRRSAGANLSEAHERFGVDVMQQYEAELTPWLEQGYITYDAHDEILRLTEKGMEVGNQIFEIFV